MVYHEEIIQKEVYIEASVGATSGEYCKTTEGNLKELCK